jgi:hypothetical protein
MGLMGGGKISIELQRMFAHGDALCRARMAGICILPKASEFRPILVPDREKGARSASRF